MEYCTTCLTPNTRPQLVINDGICSACRYAEKQRKNIIDYKERGKELDEFIGRIKNYALKNNSNYDCIVPWSGGKDSSSIALRLKDEYGLNPLLVRFNALIPTDVGEKNCNELLSYGFDSIQINANVKASKKLSYRFFVERGNPKLHWDAGVSSALFRSAIMTRIPFIVYAEHGPSEYGGRILNKNSSKYRDFEEVIENTVGDNTLNWITEGDLTKKDIFPYVMPSIQECKEHSIECHYFGYYRKWNVVENYRYVSSKINFQTAQRGRTYGTYTNFDSLDDYMDDLYYYLNYIKFGYGRCIRDLSRHIQKGEISREEALKHAKKYDGEYPEDSIPYILDYLNISIERFREIIDSHRTSSIWEKINNQWRNKLLEKLR